jgi:excisionase family DNA binding protein
MVGILDSGSAGIELREVEMTREERLQSQMGAVFASGKYDIEKVAAALGITKQPASRGRKPKPPPAAVAIQPSFAEPARLGPLAVGPEEAARLTGTTRSAIYEAIQTGALVSFKAGKRRLILIEELEAWLRRLAAAGRR